MRGVIMLEVFGSQLKEKKKQKEEKGKKWRFACSLCLEQVLWNSDLFKNSELDRKSSHDDSFCLESDAARAPPVRICRLRPDVHRLFFAAAPRADRF